MRCACVFENRDEPDFSGKPPVVITHCGYHGEQNSKRDAMHIVISLLAGKLELPEGDLIAMLNKAEEELRAKRWLT